MTKPHKEKAANQFVILLDGKEDKGTAVELAPESTIADIADLHERLRAALDSGDPVTVDAENAEKVDTAVMQLLCSFARSAAEQKIEIDWQDNSHALSDAARRLGLDAELGL